MFFKWKSPSAMSQASTARPSSTVTSSFWVSGDAPQCPCHLFDRPLVLFRGRDSANGRHIFHSDPSTIASISPNIEALHQQRVRQIARHRDHRVICRLEPASPGGRQTCRLYERKFLKAGPW